MVTLGAGNPWAVVADFDGDRRLDLITGLQPGGAPVFSWRRGDGAGGFGPPVVPFTQASNLFGLAAGDLNADGKPDVVVASVPGSIELNTSR